ncbi:MAG: single-stranded DNA-binding protein [Cellulosilyticum sp.]|nr:single-stranded DNA-binding protein [Cellulosilyticum sp.]
MNKVILMGRLTRDPEVHYSRSETPIKFVNYSLAVNNSYSKSDNVDFINMVAFRNEAEFAEKYLKKGNLIVISGRLYQDRWEDAENKKHSQVKVIVEHQEIVDNSNSKRLEEETQVLENQVAVTDEELPF